MVIAATSCGSVLGSVDLHACLSSLLPEIVSKDSKTRPYRCGWRASGEHSAQRELAFEHTDRRFHPRNGTFATLGTTSYVDAGFLWQSNDPLSGCPPAGPFS